MGGYDLWENRDNRTATPLGEFDKEKTGKPQASIDILSKGSFSDPENYRPDSLLKLTVYVWPPNDPGKSFYHGRIKVYFIRDDTPSNGRAVPMFVTARGVSSCGTSPFAQFYGSAESGQVPDIAKETTIQVPWVAPWRSPQVGLPQAAMPSSSADAAPTSSVSAVAINSSAPSGLDQTAIASSRAKMVNAAGSQVRAKLRAMLTCPPRRFMHFHETDLVYSRLAAAAMTAEIRQLPAAGEHARELRNYVGSYSAPSTVAPVSRPAYQLPGGSGGGPAKPLPKATAFPALTLAGRGLSHADRDALHAAGIYSGLDLVDIPVSELAERLGTDEDRAHQIRLRAIGVTHIGASSSTGDSPRADM